MRTLKVGQKVELNALGKERVERRLGKTRRRGEIVGLSKAYPESYLIKWETRKTIDMLHCDFVMDAADYVEPIAPKTPADKVGELRRTDDSPFNAGFNAAIDEVLALL